MKPTNFACNTVMTEPHWRGVLKQNARYFYKTSAQTIKLIFKSVALLRLTAIASALFLLAGIAIHAQADTASLCQMPSIDPAKLHLMFHEGTNKAEIQAYADRAAAVMPCSQKPIIPKIIHQVWIGPAPLIGWRKAYMSTWKKHHPDWQYKLWTDKDVENWEGTFYLKDLYDRSYLAQEKVDILRLNILYRYGGLYVDVDIACAKKFDALHHKYDFYASTNPPTFQVFASKPNNPIFLDIFKEIAKGWDKAEEHYLKTNPSIKRAYYLVWLAVVRTQQRFSQEVRRYCASDHRCILLPDKMLYHDVHYQTLFCLALKALRVFPSLSNVSNTMFVISNAMSSERKSRIRSTVTYNNIDKKIKIEETRLGPISTFRNWIHNNIDVCFVGC